VAVTPVAVTPVAVLQVEPQAAIQVEPPVVALLAAPMLPAVVNLSLLHLFPEENFEIFNLIKWLN
jgi:hypothetical protein